MFKNKIRVSSGVSQLDQLLGGLFIGDNVVWYDDAGSLASVFAFNFIHESQEKEKPLIYFSFGRSPRTIIEELGPLAKSRHLTILDCFTHGKGDSSEVFSKFYEKDGAQWPYQVIMVKEPWKPEQVAESIYTVHEAMKSDVRFVFESLTGMQDLWGGGRTDSEILYPIMSQALRTGDHRVLDHGKRGPLGSTQGEHQSDCPGGHRSFH